MQLRNLLVFFLPTLAFGATNFPANFFIPEGMIGVHEPSGSYSIAAGCEKESVHGSCFEEGSFALLHDGKVVAVTTSLVFDARERLDDDGRIKEMDRWYLQYSQQYESTPMIDILLAARFNIGKTYEIVTSDRVLLEHFSAIENAWAWTWKSSEEETLFNLRFRPAASPNLQGGVRILGRGVSDPAGTRSLQLGCEDENCSNVRFLLTDNGAQHWVGPRLAQVPSGTAVAALKAALGEKIIEAFDARDFVVFTQATAISGDHYPDGSYLAQYVQEVRDLGNIQFLPQNMTSADRFIDEKVLAAVLDRNKSLWQLKPESVPVEQFNLALALLGEGVSKPKSPQCKFSAFIYGADGMAYTQMAHDLGLFPSNALPPEFRKNHIYRLINPMNGMILRRLFETRANYVPAGYGPAVILVHRENSCIEGRANKGSFTFCWKPKKPIPFEKLFDVIEQNLCAP